MPKESSLPNLNTALKMAKSLDEKIALIDTLAASTKGRLAQVKMLEKELRNFLAQAKAAKATLKKAKAAESKKRKLFQGGRCCHDRGRVERLHRSAADAGVPAGQGER